MLQFIRLRPGGDFWVGAGFISDHRTASQLLSQREAARMVQNFVQPIILALASAGFGKSPGRTFGYLLFYAVFYVGSPVAVLYV